MIAHNTYHCNHKRGKKKDELVPEHFPELQKDISPLTTEARHFPVRVNQEQQALGCVRAKPAETKSMTLPAAFGYCWNSFTLNNSLFNILWC